MSVRRAAVAACCIVLAPAGYQVSCAGDWDAAEEALQNKQPELVIVAEHVNGCVYTEKAPRWIKKYPFTPFCLLLSAGWLVFQGWSLSTGMQTRTALVASFSTPLKGSPPAPSSTPEAGQPSETNPPPVENLDHLSRGSDGVAEVHRGGEEEVLRDVDKKTAGKTGEGRRDETGREHPLADASLEAGALGEGPINVKRVIIAAEVGKSLDRSIVDGLRHLGPIAEGNTKRDDFSWRA